MSYRIVQVDVDYEENDLEICLCKSFEEAYDYAYELSRRTAYAYNIEKQYVDGFDAIAQYWNGKLVWE